MVIIITGPTHVGKTILAQKILEKYKISYLSIDHLKMGLIRSKATKLTPYDDEELTIYLWNIVKEIIKTAIENKQNLVVEGCYIPFNFRKSFNDLYLKDIIFIALAMSEDYIKQNYKDIIAHESDIEKRIYPSGVSLDELIGENNKFVLGFEKEKEQVVIINKDYNKEIDKVLDAIKSFIKSEKE